MRRVCLVVWLLILATPVLGGDRYLIDGEASSIRFTVPYDFMILGQLRGEFRQFSGEVLYDADKPEATTVTVEITTSSVDTRFEARDIGLKGETFLAVDTYPEARFEGRDVRRVGGNWVVAGDLTMRQISRPAEVTFGLLDLEHTLVVDGTASLSREAFEITGPELTGDIVIGDEVWIELHVVLRRVESRIAAPDR